MAPTIPEHDIWPGLGHMTLNHFVPDHVRNGDENDYDGGRKSDSNSSLHLSSSPSCTAPDRFAFGAFLNSSGVTMCLHRESLSSIRFDQ